MRVFQKVSQKMSKKIKQLLQRPRRRRQRKFDLKSTKQWSSRQVAVNWLKSSNVPDIIAELNSISKNTFGSSERKSPLLWCKCRPSIWNMFFFFGGGGCWTSKMNISKHIWTSTFEKKNWNCSSDVIMALITQLLLIGEDLRKAMNDDSTSSPSHRLIECHIEWSSRRGGNLFSFFGSDSVRSILGPRGDVVWVQDAHSSKKTAAHKNDFS